MKAVAKEWLIAAYDDLKVIGHLSGDDGLTHMVAFHAQQAVEKGLKAIMEEHGMGFPQDPQPKQAIQRMQWPYRFG